MRLEPRLHNIIRHLRSNKVGKVITVNDLYGWFEVQYEDGKHKIYQMGKANNRLLAILTREQYADHLLHKENMGVTTFWRD